MGEFLKCDADNCDHVEQVESITSEMVDMPCPICGSNLLTKEDWDNWSGMVRPILKIALDVQSKLVADGEMVKTTVHLHEDTLSFTTTPPAKEGE